MQGGQQEHWAGTYSVGKTAAVVVVAVVEFVEVLVSRWEPV